MPNSLGKRSGGAGLPSKASKETLFISNFRRDVKNVLRNAILQRKPASELADTSFDIKADLLILHRSKERLRIAQRRDAQDHGAEAIDLSQHRRVDRAVKVDLPAGFI